MLVSRQPTVYGLTVIYAVFSMASSQTSVAQLHPAVQSSSSADQSIANGPEHVLVYSSDGAPGITRKRAGDYFHYFDAHGKRIRDKDDIARINALAIPPAYQDVWICPDPHGHIQATARDARGRKQYRYHPQWRVVRDEVKYQQLAEFALALPKIRRQVKRDMAAPGISQRKVVAVVVRLLELTLIRVGDREYARTNKSYGLTTLRRRHTAVAGDRIRFCFKGKSGVRHDVTVADRRVARVVKRCMDIPGYELFTYVGDDGNVHTVSSADVNAYLKEAGGGLHTAKHYRTWAGSVHALAMLQKRRWEAQNAAKAVVEVVREVARRLGNTPAVCRGSYIHPGILQSYLDGVLPKRMPVHGPRGLNADERRLYAFLYNESQSRKTGVDSI
jgi:DNA topoisomerase-1